MEKNGIDFISDRINQKCLIDTLQFDLNMTGIHRTIPID